VIKRGKKNSNLSNKKSTGKQIVSILREGEIRTKGASPYRRHAVSDATYHRWKSKYAGLSLNELKTMKALEEENR
jgi:putative transposase